MIPWGRTDKRTDKWKDKRTDGQIFAHYSGISSHSLRGVRIFKSLGGKQLKMVVDEVSMLSAQLLVLLDTRLQLMYKPDQTFGGISVLLIGDFIQLPVTTGHDLWSILYGTVSGNDGTARELF
jgi:hypothetical protein